MYRIAILTVSDRASSREYSDRSGPLIEEIIASRTPWQVDRYVVVPDDFYLIVELLTMWAEEEIELILTTGGTGFAPRDITPEATLSVLQRQAPGIAEALRAESLKVTQHAMLSRGVAGIRGKTLIINLPGNPKAVRENLAVLLPILPHALELLTGAPSADAGHRTV